MAQNYIRQSSFTDGDTITAGLFNNEYNQLVNAFAYSSIDANATGHTHDGSLGQGGNISKIGDLDFLNKIEIDGTNNRMGFFVEVGGVTTEQVRISDGLIVPVTTNDIDLGSASLQFKDGYFDGTINADSLVLSSGSTVTAVLDEDNFVSDSATALATQQSIKAYVDAQVTAQDLDFQGDTGGALSIDLDSETLTLAGGTGIDTAGSSNTLTVSIDSTVATLTGTQTLTNKTIDADNNTVSNLEVDNLKAGVLDTDISAVAGTHTTLPSALAVKTYVDAQVTAQDLDIVGDTGTDAIDLDSETLTFIGGTGITSVVTAGTVTHNIDSTVATLTGTQTLTNKTIDADNNTVSNLEVDNLKTGVLDTDLTTVSSLHDTIPSAKAVFDYVADLAGSANPIFTGTVTADNLIVNGNSTLGSDAADTLTVNADIASDLIPSVDGTYDLGASGSEWQDLFIDGTANIDSLVADTADINGGTIDGTVVGGTTPAAVTTTALVATTADINGGTIDGTVIGGSTAAAITGTTITGTSFVSSGDMTFEDNDKAVFGDGSDLRIYHTGSHSTIENIGTGHLQIHTTDFRLRNSAGTESMILANADGDVQLYYNNALKLATTATGIDVTGVITTDGMTTSADINFGDDDKAIFGAGSDLQIYHDGSNSWINEVGTGQLILAGEDVRITTPSAGEFMATFGVNGAATLYYDNASKLATTATGIDVTGGVTATSLKATDNINIQADDAQLYLTNAANTDYFLIKRTGASGDLAFDHFNGSTVSERLRITSAGNVGIGNTAPVSALQVQASSPVITAAQSNTLITSGELIGAFNAYSADTSTNSKGGVGGVRVFASSTYDTGNTPSHLSFWTHPDSANNNTELGGALERARIDSSGRIVAVAGSAFVSNTTTTSISKTLINGEQCVVDTATQTLTLPASPSTGDNVSIFVGNFTDTVVARNSSNIMGLAEDLTIDSANVGIKLVYIDASNGWRILV